VQGWYDRTTDRVTAWTDALEATDMPDDPRDADPEVVRDAADSAREVIDELEADPAPAIAADHETVVIDFLQGMADYLDAMADGIENGDDLDAITAEFEPTMTSMFESIASEEQALASACELEI